MEILLHSCSETYFSLPWLNLLLSDLQINISLCIIYTTWRKNNCSMHWLVLPIPWGLRRGIFITGVMLYYKSCYWKNTLVQYISLDVYHVLRLLNINDKILLDMIKALQDKHAFVIICQGWPCLFSSHWSYILLHVKATLSYKSLVFLWFVIHHAYLSYKWSEASGWHVDMFIGLITSWSSTVLPAVTELP